MAEFIKNKYENVILNMQIMCTINILDVNR